MFLPQAASGGVSSGSKNYLSAYNGNTGNGNFEGGTTTGFSLGTVTLTSNLPSGVPTFGSGASGNLALVVVSSGQLAGLYSGSYASSAATTAGNFLASDAFTIDIEDQAKILTFTFYYKAQTNPTNGNFSGTSSNSFGVAIWDVTNSAWIVPAGAFGMTQNSGIGYCTGTFQTTSNSTQYRLVVYNANASSGAITLYFDDFTLGPLTAPLGVPASDGVAYTPSFGGGFGTVASIAVKQSRIANMLLVEGTFSAGTTGAGVYSISLPSGLSIDTTKISIGNTTSNPGQSIGFWTASATTGGNGSIVTATGTSATVVYFGGGTGGSATNTPASGAGLVANSAVIGFWFQIPITGWSSNVQMSNDTDTRVVAGRATGVTASITGSYSDLTWAAINSDTHGAFNASSSAITYTIPVTGFYDFSGQVYVSATTIAAGNQFTVSLFNNTSSTTLLETQYTYQGTNTTSEGIPFNYNKVFLNAGTAIKIQAKSNTTVPVITSSSTENFFSVGRTSGPSVIAATESVNARYHSATATITGSASAITYTTKDFDTHNAYSGTTYTIPVSGKYQINAAIIVAATFAATNLSAIYIFKNGSAYSSTATYAGGIQGDAGLDINDIVQCNAGDTIVIEVSSAGTGPTVVASTTTNYFSIARVGN